MIIVMARQACSSLACLTSLTPPEQAARLNDKVVSANPSWFRAPRKIDTYFSLLRCSLKCDIINCSSSSLSFVFFFFFCFLVWRFKALGRRGHWAELSQCQWSSGECFWSLKFFSAKVGEKKKKKTSHPRVTANAEKQKTEGCMRWVLWVLWTILIFMRLKWIFSTLWPSNLTLFCLLVTQRLTHISTPIHRRQALCFAVIISLLVSWLYELQRWSGSKAVIRLCGDWQTKTHRTVEYYCIATEQESTMWKMWCTICMVRFFPSSKD